MKTARSLLLAVLLAAIAAVAAACGSSSSGSPGSADPAGAVPAGAPVYVEADVHPGGRLGTDVTAVLKRILRTDDPAAKLKGLIDSSARKDGVTYDRDIRPWLGDRVGVALVGAGTGRADYVAISGSKDDARARAALTKGSKVVKRSYKGVDYSFKSSDGTATAAFGGRAFAGTENGLKAAIDATQGQSLAQSNGLRAARAKVASERAGFLYIDVQGVLQIAEQSAGGANPQLGAALQAVGSALPKTLAAALEPEADLIRIDAVSLGSPRGSGSGRSGADAVARLPGDAFAALGAADLGGSLQRTLKAVGGSGLGSLGVEALLRQVKDQTGLDVRRDLLSWMGDAGIYVSGSSAKDLHGALVVHSTDPVRTRAAIAGLERLARTQAKGTGVGALSAPGVDDGFSLQGPGAPRVDVALAGDTFVIAVGGDKALREALTPSSTLGSAPAFTAAAGRLGDGIRPSFFLDMTKVTSLIASRAGGDRQFARVKPYLDALAALVAGAKDEGDGVTRARFAITLK